MESYCRQREEAGLLYEWNFSAYPAFDPPELDSGGPYRDVTGSPLLVLKSVSLMTNCSVNMQRRLPSSVYGHVVMIDDFGNEFSIFNRHREDAKELALKTIPLDPCGCWKLPLLNQCNLGSPRCFPKSFTLHISLLGIFKDADYVLVDACLTTGSGSPQLQLPSHKDYFHYTLTGVSHCTAPLDGIMDLCAVDYEVFRHALVLDVDISLVGDHGANADVASSGVVSGSIIAKNQDGHVPSSLLDAEIEKPQKLDFGVKTKLSTVAIPSSSVISFQINLEVGEDTDTIKVHNDGDVLRGSFLYEPYENVCVPFAFVLSGKRFKVILFAYCVHAMKFLPEYELREWCYPKRLCRAILELEKWLDSDIQRDYHHFIKFEDSKNASDASSKRSSKTKRKANITSKLRFVRPQYWYATEIPFMPQEMVELFCITVYWNSCGEPVSKQIDGEIKLCFFSGKSITLFCGKACVSPGKPIALRYPSECIRGENFHIKVSLVDSQNSEISYGSVIFNTYNAECCYNRRTCSIIKGQCGYAALYYTLFSDAIQAKLKFTLESKSNKSNVSDDDMDVDSRVYGKIIARYNNFMYCTTYDEDYYQSVLFQKDSREAVSVGADGGIPLSKCVVAVPLIASLLIQACIFVKKIDGTNVQTLKIQAHFNPKKPEEKLIKTHHGSNYCSSVSVEWSR